MKRRARLLAVSCPDCGRPIVVSLDDETVRCAECGATGTFGDALKQLSDARRLLVDLDPSLRQLGAGQRQEIARDVGWTRLAFIMWAVTLPILACFQSRFAPSVPPNEALRLLYWFGPLATWFVGGMAISRRLVSWPRWIRLALRAAPPRPGYSTECCRVCGASLPAPEGGASAILRCDGCSADSLVEPSGRPIGSLQGYLALTALDEHVAVQAVRLSKAPRAPVCLIVACAFLAPWVVLAVLLICQGLAQD